MEAEKMSYSVQNLRSAKKNQGFSSDLKGLVLELTIRGKEPTQGVFLVVSDSGDQLSLIRVDEGDGKSDIIRHVNTITIQQIVDPQPAKLPALESAMAWLPA